MVPPRTAFDRSSALDALVSDPFDVLVIGGGITGAGVALDAAARGLRTALVERADLAAGTSSRSSKLVHGGLRYLQAHEFALVHESLAERQRLLANAPHLVRPLPFLIPLFGSQGVVNRTVARTVSTGLWLYDLTGGLRIGHRHRRVGPEEVQAHLPTVRTDRVVAGWVYYDAQADDARLTLAVARTAVLDHGAVAANYAPVTGLRRDAAGRVRGAVVAPLDREPFELRAGVVVNATGVWADRVDGWAEDPPSSGPGAGAGRPGVRPAKGVHVTVGAGSLPCDTAAVVPVPGEDRTIFVVPWGDQVYLGTTDTDYRGSLEDPRATAEDVAYLLGAVNAWVTRPLTPADVTGVWAGLRPLLADDQAPARTADLSRRHSVHRSPSGLVSVTGGKLTTYRRMAADTVDEVVAVLGRGRRRSPTAGLRLRGSLGVDDLGRGRAALDLGTDPATFAHLGARYGGEARAVLALVRAHPELGQPLVEGLPYLAAEAVYGARYEMAHTLTDVLSRRTRALLRDRLAVARAAPAVAALLAPELGWDEDRVAAEVQTLVAEVAADGEAAGLPAPEPLARG